ncbi:hypothetical protein ACWD8L_18545 [Streptomyces sp. NPDC005133]
MFQAIDIAEAAPDSPAWFAAEVRDSARWVSLSEVGVIFDADRHDAFTGCLGVTHGRSL